MSRRSTRVVSVSSASNSRTTSKPKNSTLYRAYKSVFGPSKSKLASIARFRSVIEGCDEFLNNITDKNIPDLYGQIPKILNIRNENYDKLSDATRLTAEDIAPAQVQYQEWLATQPTKEEQIAKLQEQIDALKA
jgi:hypothetical protein